MLERASFYFGPEQDVKRLRWQSSLAPQDGAMGGAFLSAPVVDHVATAPAVFAALVPVKEHIAPAPVMIATSAPVVKHIAPVPAVAAAPAPVVENLHQRRWWIHCTSPCCDCIDRSNCAGSEDTAPAPAGIAAVAPVVECIAPVRAMFVVPAPAVSVAPAPVAEHIARCILCPWRQWQNTSPAQCLPCPWRQLQHRLLCPWRQLKQCMQRQRQRQSTDPASDGV